MNINDIPMLVSHHQPKAHLCASTAPCRVPLSPDAVEALRAEYNALLEANNPSTTDTPFDLWLYNWTEARRGSDRSRVGLDDGRTSELKHLPAGDIRMIDRPPPHVLKGNVKSIVLLVDFPDRPHDPKYTSEHFSNLLFGTDNKGSMTSYYRDISGRGSGAEQGERGIEVGGQVQGWYTMPNPSTFYTAGQNGLGAYPHNCQKLTENAVDAAVRAGVKFPAELDVYKEGLVAGLIVIHSGSAAEQTRDDDDIWSHKYIVSEPRKVGDKLRVSTYLTLPEDCYVGVCAHEFGHLVGRWADFYDTGPTSTSSGLGDFCLMASGSWGNGGHNPTYPNCMLRMFHDWVDVTEVNSSGSYSLTAVSEGGSVLMIKNDKTMTEDQYIMVEYRRKVGRDTYLPDQGLAIYVIDEAIPDVNDEKRLAIELLQADGRRDLANYRRQNRGDDRDLYPGINNSTVGRETNPAGNFPGSHWSGVTIQVNGKKGEAEIKLDVKFD